VPAEKSVALNFVKASHSSDGLLHNSSEQQTSASGTELLYVTMTIRRLHDDLQLINSRFETLKRERKLLFTAFKAQFFRAWLRQRLRQVGLFKWANIAFILSLPFVAQYIRAWLRQRQRPL
jgi:hypothetical protein